MVWLLACLLLVPALAAEEPDAWAREAVDFMVGNQLLAPEALRPKDAATRAELADATVRLLNVQTGADLRQYSDVTAGAWYYDAMSRAVAAGIFQGSSGKLSPNQTLTREQAVVVLARCFGLPAGDTAELARFSDGWQLSDWSAGAWSSMIAEGYVQGSGGRLNPRGTVTRQELAQMIYRLAGCVSRGGSLPESGNVVLRAGETLPSNVTIQGDLQLGCDFAEPVVLRDVRVTGRLVIHGGSVELSGTSSASEIVCCGPGVVLNTARGGAIRVAAGDAVISGGGTVYAQAPTELRGGFFEEVSLNAVTVTVSSGAQVARALLDGKNGRLTGDGTVSTAVLRRTDCVAETAGTDIQEALDAGIRQVKLTAAVPLNDAKPSSPALQTTVRFDNVDTKNCAGASKNVRNCTLSWYVNGVLAQKTFGFPLSEGATASFSATANYQGRVKPTCVVTAVLGYGDETVVLSQTADLHTELLPSPVRTLQVEATVLRDTPLYSQLMLSGWMGTVKAGTKVIYDNYYEQTSGRIHLPDGRVGWVRWNDLRISTKDYVRYTDYTTLEKENFVNQKAYESTTGYLVWVSLLTQKVNVFQGAKRDWSLIHTFACCSGRNVTPTIAGVFRYQYRNNFWDFGDYYVNRPMIFNGGHAFHTRTYVKATGALLDPTMGRPASHGCVRMYDADVNWLWDNMPFGTTVVVY